MNLFNWRREKWQKHAVTTLTFVVLVFIVSHPELRLLLPLIDAMGLDVLLTLLSVQCISLFGDYVKPALRLMHRNLVPPLAGKCHSLMMFLTGSPGHYLTIKFYDFHSRMLTH